MKKNSVLSVYNSINLSFDHGDGVYLYTEDGTRYLDFTSGIGVTCLGHSHPALVSALKDQAGKLWHCSNLFKIKGQENVAQKITDHSFAESVFFCNSGAEAVEAGIKAIRRYYYMKGETKKNKIICVKNAFHGRTYAAISASGQSKMLEGFLPKLSGFHQVEFNDIKKIEDKVDENTAGVLIETVQGEGGITPANKDYLRKLNKLAKEKDILLFFDEVQCGVGRTGKFLAVEWVKNLKPNIVGGNPLGMAVADVVLNHVLKEDFLDHVRHVGYNLREKLKKEIVAKYPKLVSGVRGLGLMVGLVAIEKNEILINALREERLLTVRAGMNVIRMLPPLILELKHVNEAIEKIDKAFSKF